MRFLLIPLMILTVFAGGCVTTNKKHNTIHMRAARQSVRELHEGLDMYLLK